jgi:hypothetical protein
VGNGWRVRVPTGTSLGKKIEGSDYDSGIHRLRLHKTVITDAKMRGATRRASSFLFSFRSCLDFFCRRYRRWQIECRIWGKDRATSGRREVAATPYGFHAAIPAFAGMTGEEL